MHSLFSYTQCGIAAFFFNYKKKLKNLIMKFVKYFIICIKCKN